MKAIECVGVVKVAEIAPDPLGIVSRPPLKPSPLVDCIVGRDTKGLVNMRHDLGPQILFALPRHTTPHTWLPPKFKSVSCAWEESLRKLDPKKPAEERRYRG